MSREAANMENDICNICCDKFTTHLRKPVLCNYCNDTTCLKCTKTYLLTTTQDAHCMNCRNGWTREFLDSVLSKTWMDGEYKKRREDVLCEREKSMLPETMPHVEHYLQVKKLNNDINEIRNKKRKLLDDTAHIRYLYDGTIDELLEAYKKKQEVSDKEYELNKEIGFLQYHLNLLMRRNQVVERKQFVRACPADGCRGFLSTQWKCGLCNVWVCPDCHEIKGLEKDAEHTCQPENVATAKLLSKDSKPCPKCASMIFKIDGCNQIFCTQCHIAFDWVSGRIETGRIHNPHYYEYLRTVNNGAVPREPGDAPCGGMPNTYWLRRQFGNTVPVNLQDKILSVLRMYYHIEAVEVPRHRVDLVTNNRDLRIKFLANEMDEQELKRLLQQREKQHTKKREIMMVLQMFLQVTSDITQRMTELVNARNNTAAGSSFFGNPTKKYIEDLENIMVEYDNLKVYSNNCLEKISKRYNNKIFQIRTNENTGIWF